MVWANLKRGLTKTSTTADDINPASHNKEYTMIPTV